MLADVVGIEGVVVGEQHHRIGLGDLIWRRLDARHHRVDDGGLGDVRISRPYVRPHALQQLCDADGR